jgi:hypothetical protein
MSVVLSYWGQLWQSASDSFSHATSVRKINYLPQGDSDTSDSEDEDEIAAPDSTTNAGTAPPKPDKEAIRRPESVVYIDSRAEREASDLAIEQAQKLISSFCRHTSVTRVAPTSKELEGIWSTCVDISSNLTNRGKGELFTAIAMSLAEHLCEQEENEWKLQYRVLCLVEFLYCRPGLERHIAGLVMDADTVLEHLHHLTMEMTPCRQQALKVMQLSHLAEATPASEEIQVGSDGDIFISKADAEGNVMTDDDLETNAGSCSYVEATDSQDEPCVASGSVSTDTSPQSHQRDDRSNLHETPIETVDRDEQLDLVYASEVPDICKQQCSAERPNLETPSASIASHNKCSSKTDAELLMPRRVIPVIPWGIEDTLPVPADPFASLATELV